MCACFIDGLLLRDNSYHGSGRIRTHGLHNKRACVGPSIYRNAHVCQEKCMSLGNPSVTGGHVSLGGSFRCGAAYGEALHRLAPSSTLPLQFLLELFPAFIYLGCSRLALALANPGPWRGGPVRH